MANESDPRAPGGPNLIPNTPNPLDRALAVMPDGTSSAWRSVYNDVIIRTEGAYVWNAQGRRYIDFLCAWGPIVIGHCDPRVNAAVHDAIDSCDLNAIGPQQGEAELAEEICEVMPSAEKVAFCTSGTDATLHAVHLVRAGTGRRRVLKFHGSFHGWHDHLAVGVRAAPGSAREMALRTPESSGLHPGPVEDCIVVEWNDFEGVREAFSSLGSELAGLFCEPYVHGYGCIPPHEGFLETLRELCTKHRVPLVFDEIKSGFRHHVGGYQAICGVIPDVTTFSKALGNGYTIAGVAGSAQLMDHFKLSAEQQAVLDGTHNAQPYAIAASRTTLEILRAGGIERLYELGEMVREGLRKAIRDTGTSAVVAGIGSSWIIYFRDEPPRNFREALDSDVDRAGRFSSAMREAGIVEPLAAYGDRRLCLATTEDDIRESIEAATRALNQSAQA